MIVTNGGGAGVLAADEVGLGGGCLAPLSAATLQALDAVLPSTWSRGNPVDIIGDAPVARYLATFAALAADTGIDAILFIHAPTAIVPSGDIAHAMVAPMRDAGKPVFACWMGGPAVAGARSLCRAAGIPTYDTPEAAARAYLQLVDYRRNQTLLRETPPAATTDTMPDRRAAQAVVDAALADGRTLLSECEAKAVLAAYGVPTVPTRIANTPAQAAALASEIGFPVAIKVLSPDISHKSDVGGVVLDLATPEATLAAAEAMQARILAKWPKARLQGFTVQAMIKRPGAVELIVGASIDPVFGPIVLFGQGGTAVEVIDDHAIGLPPLNRLLARELVRRTRVSRLLAGYRDQAAADHAAIEQVLMAVSQLLCEMPQVQELDINPLLADASGVVALDARMVVKASCEDANARLAIRPYPQEQEQWLVWAGRRILLRPIRPEDEAAHRAFFAALDLDDIRARFFGVVRNPVHDQLARFTQIDYEREMAFIATWRDGEGPPQTLGVVRAVCDPDNREAEFALIVRSDLKQQGLGRILMQKLIAYCRERGTVAMVGDTMASNDGMIRLAHRLGFDTAPSADDESLVRLHLVLSAEGSAAGG